MTGIPSSDMRAMEVAKEEEDFENEGQDEYGEDDYGDEADQEGPVASNKETTKLMLN